MTTMYLPSTNLPPNSATLARRTGNLCPKPLFGHLGKLKSSDTQGMVTLPCGRVTASTTRLPRFLLLLPAAVGPQLFNSHSSRVGSVQRILSVVPVEGIVHFADPFGAGTTDRMLFVGRSTRLASSGILAARAGATKAMPAKNSSPNWALPSFAPTSN